MGPIEYVEFAFDEHDVCENFAWVVFKHSSSVEDSIKLFCNTKLYGLPIITKNYSKHMKDPVFHEQLDYFKQLINVERSNQSKEINTSRWNDQMSNKSNIPESLPEPPTHSIHQNKNIYDRDSGKRPTQSYKNTPSLYQHNNLYVKNRNLVNKNEHNSSDKIYYNHGHFQMSDHNSISDSMKMSSDDRDLYPHYDKDLYHSQNYDHKHRDYNINAAYIQKESKNHNQGPLCINGKNSAKDDLPVRDLRDTMYRKRMLNYNDHIKTNSNASCKPIDLRDTLHHRKNIRHSDLGQHESDSSNRWPDRNYKNTYGGSGLPDREPRKNSYNSERYIETNTKHKYNYNRNFNLDKSKVNSQEYEHEYPNNYNNSYNQEKYTSYNNKYNTRPQNMESNSHQYNPYHLNKRNDCHKKKEYTNNLYDEQSVINHGRSFNKKGTDQSKQHFY